MPDVAQVLKAEITRLARKEAVSACRQLRKQVQELKETTRSQRQRLDQLEKELARAQSGAPIHKMKTGEEEADKKVRITPGSIKRHRLRLKLSQREMGKLLGVSTNTVVQWEAGKSGPRGSRRDELAKLRQLGRRQVKELLAGE